MSATKTERERADLLESALARIGGLAASDGASRDPYGTLDEITYLAWKAIGAASAAQHGSRE